MLEELEKLRECDIIIVEGRKDEKALNRLGFYNIKRLNKPIYKIADECACCDNAAILTDLDSEGKRLYAKLRKCLSQMGIRIDNRFRNFLFRKTKLRQIEGLANYIDRNSLIAIYPDF
ncbi:hypothetical protein GF323_02880 [Candidatus Woesearchaeota archaeon]|nr:hypothetical protein [Candidatus Woesearchaeota archaeon]